MGVDRSDLIVVGVDIGQELYDDDHWELEGESHYEKYDYRSKSKEGEIAYIYDGMSGRYFIVGELVKSDYEGYSGLGRFVHDEKSKEFKASKKRVKKFIQEMFGIEVEPKYITMTHYH